MRSVVATKDHQRIVCNSKVLQRLQQVTNAIVNPANHRRKPFFDIRPVSTGVIRMAILVDRPSRGVDHLAGFTNPLNATAEPFPIRIGARWNL